MDMPLRIALCEDLPEDRARLLDILANSRVLNDVTVFHSGEEFLAGYKIGRYDLIFFDIYMGGMTGIETASELRKIDADISIVFTTTSLDYALESYRLEALKYLEKPVSAGQIAPILQMVYQKKQFVPKLTMRTKPFDTLVPLPDILFLEQAGTKFTAHLITGESITASGKLTAVIDELGEGAFYHCHKSFIVNFAYVKRINKELLMFEMIEGENVHIRRDGFWKTKRAYEAFLFGDATQGVAHV